MTETPLFALAPNLVLVWICVAGFLSGVVNCATGVGGAAVLLPLLLPVMAPAEALAVVSLSQITRNVLTTLVTWRHAHWNLVWRLALGGIVGAVVGGLLVGSLPDVWVRRTLAVGLLLFVFAEVRRTEVESEIPLAAMPAIGGLTGWISALLGTAGPVTAPFLFRYGLTAMPLVATLSAANLATNLAKMSTYAALGFFTKLTPTVCWGTIGSVIVGVEVGVFLLRRIDPARFKIIFLGMLTIVALSYLFAVVKENPAATAVHLRQRMRDRHLLNHE
ncbi:MAG: sulfite exporter TauE/SafE family protein [bacterium]